MPVHCAPDRYRVLSSTADLESFPRLHSPVCVCPSFSLASLQTIFRPLKGTLHLPCKAHFLGRPFFSLLLLSMPGEQASHATGYSGFWLFLLYITQPTDPMSWQPSWDFFLFLFTQIRTWHVLILGFFSFSVERTWTWDRDIPACVQSWVICFSPIK